MKAAGDWQYNVMALNKSPSKSSGIKMLIIIITDSYQNIYWQVKTITNKLPYLLS